MKVEALLAEGGPRGLGRVPEVLSSALEHNDDKTLLQLIAAIKHNNRIVAHRAARVLKKVAEQRPELLAGYAKSILQVVRSDNEAMRDVRTRWQMTIVLGCIPLRGRDRAVAIDLLFDRLLEDSALQKTFAIQALFNLSAEDKALRARVQVVAREFAENGTAAMRARARRLLRGL